MQIYLQPDKKIPFCRVDKKGSEHTLTFFDLFIFRPENEPFPTNDEIYIPPSFHIRLPYI
jgi:hypothetical protein